MNRWRVVAKEARSSMLRPMTTEPHTVTKKLAEVAQRLHQEHLARRAGSCEAEKETAPEPKTTDGAASASTASAAGQSIWQRRVSALASLEEKRPKVQG